MRLRGSTALLLALAGFGYVYATHAELAFSQPLQRFDEGIQLASVDFLAHGVVPLRDVYVPYGPALGAVGLPAQLVLGPSALAQRLSYDLVLALAVGLLVLWGARRARLVAAACAGAIGTIAIVVRYALPAIAILAGVLVLDRLLAGRTLAEVARERPRALAAGSAVLGLAAWFRPEYVVVTLFWAGVVFARSRERRVWPVAMAPVAVAIAPYVWIAGDGGFASLRRWWWYTLFGFRRYRGQAIVWSWPLHFVEHLDARGAAVVLTYATGALITCAWIVNALLGRRRRIFAVDPTGLAPFLGLVCAYVVYAQSVRFSPENGAGVVVLVWAAVVALRPSSPRLVPAVAAIGLLVALPAIPRLDLAISAANASHGSTVPRLNRIALNPDEQTSFPALLDLWRRYGRKQPLFVVNVRNDDAEGNEPIVYWYLDAKPAAWPASYDPGLSDRSDVERSTVVSLCRTHAPVVQHTESYSPFASPRHGSRYLDEFLALGYRVVGETPLWRLLLPRGPGCLLPEAASSTTVRVRRDSLLRSGRLPAAGALSVLLLDRSEKTGTRPRVDDVAIAVAGGYNEPAALFPHGPLGRYLNALVAGAVAPRPAALERLLRGT